MSTDDYVEVGPDQFASPWERTVLHERWRRRVRDGKPNDMVIVISPSSKTGVSGTGKTTLGTTLAEELDVSDSGFDAREQATLSVHDLAYQIIPGVEEGSAVLFDEAQGTPGEQGLHSKRSMLQSAIDTINSVLANRDKRLTVIMIFQQLSMAASDILPLIDAWLMIRYEPSDPRGPLAKHHLISVDDYDLRSPDIRTPVLEELTWPDLPDDNANYQILEQMKQEAKQRNKDSLDEEETMTVDEVVAEIENRDVVESYIQSSPGGEYIATELIQADYSLTEREAKTVKARLKQRGDLNVM